MLDLSKPVQTRDGRPVRIICTDATPDYPIVGVVGSEFLHIRCWWGSGQSVRSSIDQDTDLINVPPPEVVTFMNVYQENRSAWCGEIAQKQVHAGANLLACLKITRVEGKITKVELV
jgi:hypothetical protein